MLAVQAGGLDRFARLVERHQSALFRYAQSKLGARPLAEDAVQETFLAAYRGRMSFDPSRNFRGWLWMILVNTVRRMAKEHQRSFARSKAQLEDVPAAGDEVSRTLEQSEQQEKLAELLDRLPSEQAEAVRMRFFGELAYEEIGAALECSPATAKSRVRYGLEKMAAMLKTGQEISS